MKKPVVYTKWMTVGIALAAWAVQLLAPSQLYADGEVKDVRRTSGLALGAGFVEGTGGLGGQLAYYADWGAPRLRLGGLVGLGWSLDGSRPREKLGVSLGGFGSVGRGTHRLYFDLDASLVGTVQVGDDAFERRYWKVSSKLGYEVVTRRGFLLRAAAGPAVNVLTGSLWEPSDRMAWAGQFLMGCKLW